MHEKSELYNSKSIIEILKLSGFYASFLHVSCMEKIMQVYDNYPDKDEKTPFSVKEWFKSNQPPAVPFKPQSFLIITFQSPGGDICLNYKGKEISIPIPPTYLDDPTRRRLDETLKQITKNIQMARTKGISGKLLTVLSGLGKYGKNALCYLEGFGSYCSFDTYYTDVPCENTNHSLTFMDICESCGKCIENCPTKALGGLTGVLPGIDVSRCLCLLNESKETMPHWLSPDVHHALIGCMRCQEICPVNKSVQVQSSKKDPLKFNEKETEQFLSSGNELPPDLLNKLIDYGLWKNFAVLAGRNARLIIETIAK